MRRILSIWTAITALAVTLIIVSPGAAAQDLAQEPLKVAIKEIEPFVIMQGDTLEGFSIELWETLAQEIGLEFEYVIVSTVQEQLDAVVNGDAGAAVAAISITEEREKRVDFSHSYFRSGLGILTNLNRDHTLTDAVRAAFSPTILRILAGLIITIIIAGHVIWLLERNKNPHFPKSYLAGVWEGIWWSAVTATAVGYGDRTPIVRIGRIFGIIWMILSLLLVTNFTASVASELTVQRLEGSINGPEDLHSHYVTTVAGSTAEAWLIRHRIDHSTVKTIDDAYALLDARIAQAIVYDYPVLLYKLQRSPEKGYSMPSSVFDTEDYGIVFASDSPFREEANRALLRLVEDGTYDKIYSKYFGLDFR